MRIEHADADAEIDGLIAAATAVVEDYTGLKLVARSVEIHLDAWPAAKSSDWWDGVREGSIAALAATDTITAVRVTLVVRSDEDNVMETNQPHVITAEGG